MRSGSGGRTRVYTQRDRARLKLLLRGKRLGLSLVEIKGLLDMYETPADTVPQLTRFLDGAGRSDAQSLQQQLADLTQLLADIDRQRADAERMLQVCGPAGRPPGATGTPLARMQHPEYAERLCRSDAIPELPRSADPGDRPMSMINLPGMQFDLGEDIALLREAVQQFAAPGNRAARRARSTAATSSRWTCGTRSASSACSA